MIETTSKVTSKGNGMSIHKKVETYTKDGRTNAQNLRKEDITKKYSESYQMNLMRLAILGNTEALAKLQDIEDFINEV